MRHGTNCYEGRFASLILPVVNDIISSFAKDCPRKINKEFQGKESSIQLASLRTTCFTEYVMFMKLNI